MYFSPSHAYTNLIHLSEDHGAAPGCFNDQRFAKTGSKRFFEVR